MAQYMRMLRQAKNYMIEAEMDCERERIPADTVKKIRDIENLIDNVAEELKND